MSTPKKIFSLSVYAQCDANSLPLPGGALVTISVFVEANLELAKVASEVDVTSCEAKANAT